jgi:hypothetical protein
MRWRWTFDLTAIVDIVAVVLGAESFSEKVSANLVEKLS